MVTHQVIVGGGSLIKDQVLLYHATLVVKSGVTYHQKEGLELKQTPAGSDT